MFDAELRPIRHFSNPLFADIHDLTWDGEHIWVSSTALDYAVKVDKYGETVELWSPREDPIVANRFGLAPLPLDRLQDNRLSYLGIAHRQAGHTHLNTVSLLNGRPVALLNSFGCVVELNPTRIVIAEPALRGAHNLAGAPDGTILICNTHDQSVWAFDQTGKLQGRIRLAVYPEVRRFLAASLPGLAPARVARGAFAVLSTVDVAGRWRDAGVAPNLRAWTLPDRTWELSGGNLAGKHLRD